MKILQNLCIFLKQYGERKSVIGNRDRDRENYLHNVFGFRAGCLSLQRKGEKKRELVKKEMQRDYPDIIQKLVLFLRAGFTIRKAMEKIADGYCEARKNIMRRKEVLMKKLFVLVKKCKEEYMKQKLMNVLG